MLFSIIVFLLFLSNTTLYAAVPVIQDVNRLEIGMSKGQVDSVLRIRYFITEKRIEEGNKIEVYSYKYSYFYDEFYFHFQFKNGKLEKWNAELLPKRETVIKKE
jgi:hypothetical protein